MSSFRLNQRVCRVEWQNGIPFLEFGIVTKVTRQTYYVNDEKTPSARWQKDAGTAILAEYLSLFSDWDRVFGRRPENWDLHDTVFAVAQVRRLERRMIKKVRRSKFEEKTP